MTVLRSFLLLSASLLVAVLFTSAAVTAQERPNTSIVFDEGDYKSVNVDQMIARLTSVGDKQRYFIEPSPVKFSATLMQQPKAGTFQLVYDSLNAWGVSPMPEVRHASYLKVDGGKVVPVYLEAQVAKSIAKRMSVNQQAEFYALHIYNHEKGPRFLVVSFNEASIQ